MYDAVMQWLLEAGDLSVNSSMMLSLVFFAASFVLVPRTFLCREPVRASDWRRCP
jgi:hypothetical protein